MLRGPPDLTIRYHHTRIRDRSGNTEYSDPEKIALGNVFEIGCRGSQSHVLDVTISCFMIKFTRCPVSRGPILLRDTVLSASSAPIYLGGRHKGKSRFPPPSPLEVAARHMIADTTC